MKSYVNDIRIFDAADRKRAWETLNLPEVFSDLACVENIVKTCSKHALTWVLSVAW